MGAAAGPIGAAFSIASVGMSAFGQIQQAKGTQAADEARAAQLQRSAERGRLAAEQTGAQMTEQLNTTLQNIEAIKAASGTDVTSPTTAAVLEQQRYRGERARTISVENLVAQAQEQDASAKYLREAGDFALSQGELQAFATVAKGVGGAFGSPFFGTGQKTA